MTSARTERSWNRLICVHNRGKYRSFGTLSSFKSRSSCCYNGRSSMMIADAAKHTKSVYAANYAAKTSASCVA